MTSKFISILDKVGDGFRDFFTKDLPLIVNIAKDAEPVVDVLFPFIGPIYNYTVNLVQMAEGAAAAAGKQSGTGPQKAALVMASLVPYITQELTAAGLPKPTAAQIQTYLNAVVAGLNAFPASAS